ncbi:MAG: hypothetical protein AB8F95_10320 [Bacteroidia bacterium]
MDIIVTKNETLKEISQAFNTKFPYLKLEFYCHTHKAGEGSPKEDRLSPKLTINEAGTFDHDEHFSINGHLQVRTFENTFQEHFGVGVQVMRKSGTLWLQCTATDDWTLTKENRVGEEDSVASS